MILRGALTPGLRAWLEDAGDAGEIVVRQLDVDRIEVLRADGTDLSEAEEIEVRALLAAHATEPLTAPKQRSKKSTEGT